VRTSDCIESFGSKGKLHRVGFYEVDVAQAAGLGVGHVQHALGKIEADD
jgi:hypothetical protein